MFERTHPVAILSNLWRVVYLIIIPVVRGFLSALQQDVLAWVRGAWIDILIFLGMITVAVLRWAMLSYRMDGETVTIRAGVLFRRTTLILWDKVTSVTEVESFYLKPFRAVRLRADTIGGSLKRADVSLFLAKDRAEAMLGYYGSAASGDAIKRQYVPGARSILTMAMLTSNSFAGVVFIATFVSQSGKLLGNEFSDMIVTTFEDIARKLAFGIPPAAAAMAYVLLGGWLIGFLFTFVSYRNFVIYHNNNTLRIHGGQVTPRSYAIRYSEVNFLDIRQNIAAKALRLYSLYISAVGYGKVKDDISCIIPAEPKYSFEANLRMLFPDFAIAEPTLQSPKRGIMRFLFQPLIPIVAIPAAMGVLAYLFPSWTSFVVFTGLMLLVPSGVFLAVRIVAWRTGGIGKRGSYYTVRYSSGLSLRTVIIPESKIVLVRVRQSLFQAWGKGRTCDVVLQTVAEGANTHLCRNLPRAEAERMLRGLGAGRPRTEK